MPSRSVLFFERQFQRQVAAGEYALNDFERAALPHLFGDVLDAGCGLGNLSMAAARGGCTVSALDGSPTAIADLARRATAANLRVEAEAVDLAELAPERDFDGVVCIGAAMFLRCGPARDLLVRLRDAVRPGGIAAFTVLIEGTTYLDMFDEGAYCLFDEHELDALVHGWVVLHATTSEHAAPGDTLKRFRTVVARRP